MSKRIIMTFIFGLIVHALSQAGEKLISTAFLKSHQKLIKCQIYKNITEDYDRLDWLKCWEMKNEKHGRLVYNFSVYGYSLPLRSVSDSLLLSGWETGTVRCYKVIDFSSKKPRIVLDNELDGGLCSKAEMEIVYGKKNEVAFLLEHFNNGTSRNESKVFCLKSGKLSTQIIPFQKRIEWLKEYCWETAKPN